MRKRRKHQAVRIIVFKEGKPVQQESAKENDKGPFKNFSQHLALVKRIPAVHYKAQRVPHGKEKGRKYEISRRKAIPVRMFEWGIIKLASRCIDNDHEADGHSPENIKGKETFFGSSHFRDLGSGVRREIQVRKLPPFFNRCERIYNRIPSGYAPGLIRNQFKGFDFLSDFAQIKLYLQPHPDII